MRAKAADSKGNSFDAVLVEHKPRKLLGPDRAGELLRIRRPRNEARQKDNPGAGPGLSRQNGSPSGGRGRTTWQTRSRLLAGRSADVHRLRRSTLYSP